MRSLQVYVLPIVGMLAVCSLVASVPSSSSDKKAYAPEAADTAHRSFPVNQLPPLTYSSKNYTAYLEVANFFQAWQLCRDKGQRLATVENYQDHKAVREAILPVAGFEAAFWIAGTNVGAKPAETGTYYWITNDRPVGYLSGFENWLTGETITDPDQCIALYLGSAMWIAGTCDSDAFFVCEESQDV
ncbi:protein A16-like [Anopheles ziemanni]|uniref:protein A16-like n=1 Tax=Anopheles coustani TaxID=139045 RepID=UPI0026590DA6|nr:protein A16-like [Anopheles coustani]XP_058178359.1 protein A16-like [Anopheles ziemanni]